MHYPSKYVLLTDVDSKIINITKPNNCNQLFNSESVNNSIYSGSNSKNINNNNNEVNARHNENGTMPSVIKNSKFSPPLLANAASVLPERVWQDLLMNTAYTNSSPISSQSSISSSGRDVNNKSEVKSENNNENSLNATNADAERKGSSCLSPAIWDYSEPVHKTSCTCIK